MYRRRILCTLYGAIDFLIILSKDLYGGGEERIRKVTLRTIPQKLLYVPLGGGWGASAGPKSLDFQGPPLPMALVKVVARIKIYL
jgi:hypothetical protein